MSFVLLPLGNSIKMNSRACYKWVLGQVGSMAHTLRKLCALRIASHCICSTLALTGLAKICASVELELTSCVCLGLAWPGLACPMSVCLRFVAALMKTTSCNLSRNPQPAIGQAKPTGLRFFFSCCGLRVTAARFRLSPDKRTHTCTLTHTHTHLHAHVSATHICLARYNKFSLLSVCLMIHAVSIWISYAKPLPPSSPRLPNWNVHSSCLLFYMLPSWLFAQMLAVHASQGLRCIVFSFCCYLVFDVSAANCWPCFAWPCVWTLVAFVV